MENKNLSKNSNLRASSKAKSIGNINNHSDNAKISSQKDNVGNQSDNQCLDEIKINDADDDSLDNSYHSCNSILSLKKNVAGKFDSPIDLSIIDDSSTNNDDNSYISSPDTKPSPHPSNKSEIYKTYNDSPNKSNSAVTIPQPHRRPRLIDICMAKAIDDVKNNKVDESMIDDGNSDQFLYDISTKADEDTVAVCYVPNFYYLLLDSKVDQTEKYQRLMNEDYLTDKLIKEIESRLPGDHDYQEHDGMFTNI